MCLVKIIIWGTLILALSDVIKEGNATRHVKPAKSAQIEQIVEKRIPDNGSKSLQNGNKIQEYNMQNVKPRLALVVSIKPNNKTEQGSKNEEEIREKLIETLLETGDVRNVNSVGLTSEEAKEKRHLDCKHEELWGLVDAMTKRRNDLQDEVKNFYDNNNDEDDDENLANNYKDHKDYLDDSNEVNESSDNRKKDGVHFVEEESDNRHRESDENKHNPAASEESVEMISSIEKLSPSSLGRFLNLPGFKKHELPPSVEHDAASDQEDNSQEILKTGKKIRRSYQDILEKNIDPYDVNVKFSKHMLNALQKLNDLESLSRNMQKMKRHTTIGSKYKNIISKGHEHDKATNRTNFDLNQDKITELHSLKEEESKKHLIKVQTGKSQKKTKRRNKKNQDKNFVKHIKHKKNNKASRKDSSRKTKNNRKKEKSSKRSKHYYIDLNALVNNKLKLKNIPEGRGNHKISLFGATNNGLTKKHHHQGSNKNNRSLESVRNVIIQKTDGGDIRKSHNPANLKANIEILHKFQANHTIGSRQRRSLKSKFYSSKYRKTYRNSGESDESTGECTSSESDPTSLAQYKQGRSVPFSWQDFSKYMRSSDDYGIKMSDLKKHFDEHGGSNEESVEDWTQSKIKIINKNRTKLNKNHNDNKVEEILSSAEDNNNNNNKVIHKTTKNEDNHHHHQYPEELQPVVVPLRGYGLNIDKIAKEYNEAVEDSKVITVIPIDKPVIEPREEVTENTKKKDGRPLYLKRKGGCRIPLRLIQDEDGHFSIQLDMNYICRKCTKQREKRKRLQEESKNNNLNNNNNNTNNSSHSSNIKNNSKDNNQPPPPQTR